MPQDLDTNANVIAMMEAIDAALLAAGETPVGRIKAYSDASVGSVIREVFTATEYEEIFSEIERDVLSVVGINSESDILDMLDNYNDPSYTTPTGHRITPRIMLALLSGTVFSVVVIAKLASDYTKEEVDLAKLSLRTGDMIEIRKIQEKYKETEEWAKDFSPIGNYFETVHTIVNGTGVEGYLHELSHAAAAYQLYEWAKSEGIELDPVDKSIPELVAIEEGMAEVEEMRLLMVLEGIYKGKAGYALIPVRDIGFWEMAKIANGVYYYGLPLEVVQELTRLGLKDALIPGTEAAKYIRKYKILCEIYETLGFGSGTEFYSAYMQEIRNPSVGYMTANEFFDLQSKATPQENPRFLKLTFRTTGDVKITYEDLTEQIKSRSLTIAWLSDKFSRWKIALDLESDPYVVIIRIGGEEVSLDPRDGEFSIYLDELLSPGLFIYYENEGRADFYWGDDIIANVGFGTGGAGGQELMVDTLDIDAGIADMAGLSLPGVAATTFLHTWKLNLPSPSKPTITTVSFPKSLIERNGPLEDFVRKNVDEGRLLITTGGDNTRAYYNPQNDQMFKRLVGDITRIDECIFTEEIDGLYHDMIFDNEGNIVRYTVRSIDRKYSGEVVIIEDGEFLREELTIEPADNEIIVTVEGDKKVKAKFEIAKKSPTNTLSFEFREFTQKVTHKLKLWFNDRDLKYIAELEYDVGKRLAIDMEKAGLSIMKAGEDPQSWLAMFLFNDDAYSLGKLQELTTQMRAPGAPAGSEIKMFKYTVKRPSTPGGPLARVNAVYFGKGQPISSVGAIIGDEGLGLVFPDGVSYVTPNGKWVASVYEPGKMKLEFTGGIFTESELYHLDLTRFFGKEGVVAPECSEMSIAFDLDRGKMFFEARDIEVDRVTKWIFGGWDKKATVRIQFELVDKVFNSEGVMISAKVKSVTEVKYNIEPFGLMKLYENTLVRFLGSAVGTALFIGSINAFFVFLAYEGDVPESMLMGDVVRGSVSTAGWVSLGHFGMKRFARNLMKEGIYLGVKAGLTYATIIGILIEAGAHLAEGYYSQWKAGELIDLEVFNAKPTPGQNAYRAFLQWLDNIKAIPEWITTLYSKFPISAGTDEVLKRVIINRLYIQWLESQAEAPSRDEIQDELWAAEERARPYAEEFREDIIETYLKDISWDDTTWFYWYLPRYQDASEPEPPKPAADVADELKEKIILLQERLRSGVKGHAPINAYMGYTPSLRELRNITIAELEAMRDNLRAHAEENKFGTTSPTWTWHVAGLGRFIDCRLAGSTGISGGIFDDVVTLLKKWEIDPIEPPGSNLISDSSFEGIYSDLWLSSEYGDDEDNPSLLEKWNIELTAENLLEGPESLFVVPEGYLVDGGKYFWRVKAERATDVTLTSDTWNFTVKTDWAGSKPRSIGPVIIKDGMLHVYDSGSGYTPYFMRGVFYTATPIGKWDMSELTDAEYERDFALLENMGCNTIRVFEVNKTLLDKAELHNIKVIANFFIEDGLDFKLPDVRSHLIGQFREYVREFKNHPALLMWALGNEQNYKIYVAEDKEMERAWYTLANQMASAAYFEEGSEYHPVAIVNGKITFYYDGRTHAIGDSEIASDDDSLSYIDVWGINEYLGNSWEGNYFDNNTKTFFQKYAELTNKPLWISEFGVDAWHTNNPNDPSNGYLDESSQATYIIEGINQLANHQAGQPHDPLNPLIGFTLMSYSDEWFKTGYPDIHNYGGSQWNDLGTGVRQPDDFSNEEWYGIVSATPAMPVDTMTPRQVYNDLKGIWNP
jgi:hypothetical protein